MRKIVLMSFIVAAFFANAETTYEGRLEETVVTATSYEELNKDQIKNVTIITKEDIEDRGYNTVEEVLRNAPGINVVNNGFSGVVDIRGQGSENATKRVKILVDGVPLNILDLSHGVVPLNTVAIDDIDRIEIINGGGTVLYGSGTAGGVVNIITKKVKKEGISGNVYYQNSSYVTNKYGIDLNYNISNKLILSTGYEKINGDGYRSGDSTDTDAFKFGALYNIDEKQSIQFKTRYYGGDYVTSGGLTAEELLENRRQSTSTTESDYSFREYSLGYSNQFSDNFIIDGNAYLQSSHRYYVDQGTFEDKKRGISIKGNYNYGSGNVVAGYEFLKNKLYRNTWGVIVKGYQNTHSIFALNRHNLTNKLESTLGFRYSYSISDTDRISSSTHYHYKTNKNSYAYEAGLSYKYSDTGNVYGKFEHGYRAPSITEMIDKPDNNYIYNNIKPEMYNTFEIGVKDYILGSYVSATAFYTKAKDEITVNWLGDHRLWEFENIPGTERKGVELFAEQYFGKLRINESYTYVDAKITKGENKGQKITYVVPTKITLGAVYDLNDKVSINGDFNYYSNSLDDLYNKINHYTTVDLGTTVKVNENLTVSGGIKNVFNEKYNLSQEVNIRKRVTTYSPADERTYYIGFSYSF